MRKIFPLHIEGRHPDRVLEAVKHDIRKYIKRERRRDLPAGADFWDFDCQVGATKDAAQPVTVLDLIAQVGEVAAQPSAQVYVEVLAKPGVRPPRPEGMEPRSEAAADATEPADQDL